MRKSGLILGIVGGVVVLVSVLGVGGYFVLTGGMNRGIGGGDKPTTSAAPTGSTGSAAPSAGAGSGADGGATYKVPDSMCPVLDISPFASHVQTLRGRQFPAKDQFSNPGPGTRASCAATYDGTGDTRPSAAFTLSAHVMREATYARVHYDSFRNDSAGALKNAALGSIQDLPGIGQRAFVWRLSDKGPQLGIHAAVHYVHILDGNLHLKLEVQTMRRGSTWSDADVQSFQQQTISVAKLALDKLTT